MREKYESLSLAVLKDLAKARGIKGVSTMKKEALVERMLEEDERDKAKAAGKNKAKEPDREVTESAKESDKSGEAAPS